MSQSLICIDRFGARLDAPPAKAVIESSASVMPRR